MDLVFWGRAKARFGFLGVCFCWSVSLILSCKTGWTSREREYTYTEEETVKSDRDRKRVWERENTHIQRAWLSHRTNKKKEGERERDHKYIEWEVEKIETERERERERIYTDKQSESLTEQDTWKRDRGRERERERDANETWSLFADKLTWTKRTIIFYLED